MAGFLHNLAGPDQREVQVRLGAGSRDIMLLRDIKQGR